MPPERTEEVTAEDAYRASFSGEVPAPATDTEEKPPVDPAAEETTPDEGPKGDGEPEVEAEGAEEVEVDGDADGDEEAIPEGETPAEASERVARQNKALRQRLTGFKEKEEKAAIFDWIEAGLSDPKEAVGVIDKMMELYPTLTKAQLVEHLTGGKSAPAVKSDTPDVNIDDLHPDDVISVAQATKMIQQGVAQAVDKLGNKVDILTNEVAPTLRERRQKELLKKYPHIADKELASRASEIEREVLLRKLPDDELYHLAAMGSVANSGDLSDVVATEISERIGSVTKRKKARTKTETGQPATTRKPKPEKPASAADAYRAKWAGVA